MDVVQTRKDETLRCVSSRLFPGALAFKEAKLLAEEPGLDSCFWLDIFIWTKRKWKMVTQKVVVVGCGRGRWWWSLFLLLLLLLLLLLQLLTLHVVHLSTVTPKTRPIFLECNVV